MHPKPQRSPFSPWPPRRHWQGRRGERSEAHMTTTNNAKSKGTILIADYDFGDVSIERGIIEGAGFQLVAAQCKSEDEVIEKGRDADGVLAQYATIGAR